MNIRSFLPLLLAVLLFQGAAANAQENTWRINVKGADIHEFVEQVAQITGRTFVIDPRLKGSVTVISSESMDADAIYALFLEVLRAHGFTASQSGDLVRIQQTAVGKQTPGAEGRLSDVAPGELVTRVIAAQNVASTELVKILRPLIPQYGHIGPIEEPNVVIITDHADNIERLRRIINQIDVSDEDITEMVPLKEAWVGTVVALLEKLAPDEIGRSAKGPQRVQILANERNNSLVLRGKPRPIAEVLKLVDQLDQPATTTGATQVIRLKHADAKAMAEIITGIVSQRGSAEEGAEKPTIHADESLNAIVVRADPGTMNEILDVVAQLDVRRTQVLIEAAIVEVRVSDVDALGVEIQAVDGSGETLPLVSTALDGTIQQLLGSLIPDDVNTNTNSSDITPLPALAGAGTTPLIAAAKIDANAISFGAVVTALSTNSDAELLSTPSIMTLDNQEAKIVVGNEVPFRTGSFTTTADGANNPFTTVNREDVGLQLTVTPHVHDGTNIRLQIAQEITSVVDSAVGDSAFADVVTSKREIDTTILAEDGQTIVLGGLIQDDVTDTRRKVPLLGDIPVLGNLFRSTRETRTKTNLLVFIRPTVINSGEQATDVTTRKYQDIWEVEITGTPQDEIDGLFEGKNPAR